MPYVPPHLRKLGLQPKKITVKYKPSALSVAPVAKSKDQMWEEVRLANYGKADAAYLDR